MRIAFDATPLTEPAGGIRRYLVELVRALAESYPNDELHLLSDQSDWIPESDFEALPNLVTTPPSGPGFLGKWWSFGLPSELRRRRIDVFHGVDFAVPYLPAAPRALTLHDLSPWKPESLRPPGSERVRARGPGHVRRAEIVLTPSEAVRREALAFFGLPPGRVLAIPHGVSERFAPSSEAEITETLQKYGLSRPYLLHLGAIHSRKNVASLIAAWRLTRRRRPDLALVLAGAAPPPDDDFAPKSACFFLPNIPDPQVAALLSGAAAFVYPTLYEGFGLPALEAMKAGAPVITSMDEAICETCADAALHVDATSPENLSQAILEVIEDSALAARLRTKGFVRAAQLSWRTAAVRTREAYEQAIRRD